jgi:glutaredoxin 3
MTSKLTALIAKSTKPAVVFSTASCPYCIRAKALLQKENIAFDEHDVDKIPDASAIWNEIEKGFTDTVPAIWIKGKFVGGCTDLQKLQAQGKLQQLLAASS